MTGRALSLALRSLREGVRTKYYYILRGLLVIGLLFAVWTIHESTRWRTASGRDLLSYIAWGNFILISLAGVSSYAGVITEEKEQMTLGLLRLAGFTALSIILGKSAGMLLNTLLLIVVQVPFCMLAITFGGVTIGQIISVFSLLLAYTLFVYGLAMLCSVICQTGARATAVTLGLLLFYHLAPLLLRALVWEYAGYQPAGAWGAVDQWLRSWIESLAAYGLSGATSSRGSFGGIGFAPQTIGNLVLGAVLFTVALASFRWFAKRETSLAAAGSPWWMFWRRSGIGLGCRFGSNPIMQKDYQVLTGGRRGVVFRFVLYALLVALILALEQGRSQRCHAEMIMAWGVTCLCLELGLQAERVFRSEIREQTWGVLVALPIPLRRIIWAKVRGALIRVVPAACCVLFGALWSPAAVRQFMRVTLDEPGFWFFVFQVVFAVFLTVLYSLWSTRGALVRAVATLLMFDFLFVLMMNAGGVGSSTGDAIFTVLAMGFALGCVALAVASYRRLRVLAGE